MNKQKFLIAGICLALIVMLLTSAVCIATVNNESEPETIEEIVCDENGDPWYSITYIRVGGTDENPIYQMVIEVIGDKPLVFEGGTILGGEMGGAQ